MRQKLHSIFLSCFVVCASVASCILVDNQDIVNQLNDHEQRISALEQYCAEMNTNIVSLQSIVSALQAGDSITNVSPITQEGKTVGYVISFQKSGSITIYNGENGKDGITPIIGVSQDSDGVWYWTVNGAWLYDSNGDKVKANGKDGSDGVNGITPTLKIDGGYWYITYDNGTSWQKLGKATGEDATAVFSGVSQDDSYVYFTLANGQVIAVPILNESNSIIASISDQIQRIESSISALEIVDEQLKSRISAIEDSESELASELVAKEAKLASRIDSLRAYVNDQLKSAKDWVNATFSTLEQYQETCNTLASIEQSITALQSDLRDEITAAISESQTLMQAWVNSQLAGYYSIAEIDAKLAALKSAQESGDAELATEIAGLETSLATAKESIKTAYEQAISEAISTNNGVINAKIAADIKTASDALQGQIDSLSGRISSLESRMSKVEEDIAKILAMIQSVTPVPTYSDGSVGIAKYRAELLFEVLPREASVALAKKGTSSITIAALPTITKTSTLVQLPVVSLSDDGEFLHVVVNPESLGASFFSRTTTYSARLIASDGTSNISSGFFPIYYNGVDSYVDLSSGGTANCYIVSSSNAYRFKTVKGNSSTSVGAVKSVEVLWETFGTSEVPSKGDLIKNASYSDGYVVFEATEKRGNALIAAKDASGNILWSWHIWMTEEPKAQVYRNSAGTMLDRNLGATSTTPGSVKALGLLYEWGRKDPFLNGQGITNKTTAASTCSSWPIVTANSVLSGTNNLSYSIAHPTTMIIYGSSPWDWYCTSTTYRNNSLWASSKTIYDPCPPGYKIPANGSSGIWAKAAGSTSLPSLNSTTCGVNFGGVFTTESNCWYPASGQRTYTAGGLSTGLGGYYWSTTLNSDGYVYELLLESSRVTYSLHSKYRSSGRSVRCCKE